VTRPGDKRLDDILAVADEVASFVARGKNNFDDDIAVRRALERCLEIIGEAAKSLDDELRVAIPDVPWTEVIRLRDRLSHHYHRVEANQLWVTADIDVPQMARAIRNWRNQQPDEPPR
jgi:uncharacterized protein with HEPN domain